MPPTFRHHPTDRRHRGQALSLAAALAVDRMLAGNGPGFCEVLQAVKRFRRLGRVLTVSIGNQAINDRGQGAILVSYDDGSEVAKFGMVRADPANVAPEVAA